MNPAILNLTPHNIVLRGDNYPSQGLARVASTYIPLGNCGDVPLVRGSYGKVEGLPPEADGIIYIVSAMVRIALPSRKDLASPALLVRDMSGQIIGCMGLEVN